MNTVAVLLGAIACCGGNSPQSGPTSTGGTGTGAKLSVVATINAWGSIAEQLGGDRVQETSIIINPNTDPHSYEPSAADARTVSDATVVIENGIGYDA
ncbi:metal ABC transporter solute-binding protein, Zn/Mn family [Mycobacterium tilburgii]|uniref:metal ABC transporter solute-binding protein, Zn/Mn family n=1 Tax=Mycobacterium tilburgii TaxID=44467 RepID=UPI002E1682A0